MLPLLALTYTAARLGFEAQSAAEAAFVPNSKQQGQQPSISFICVPEAAEAVPDVK